MMNMQALIKFDFWNIAIKTLVLVAGAGASGLAFPVRTVINCRASAPGRIVYAIPVVRFPVSKTYAVAKVMFVARDLIRLSLNRLFAMVTVNRDRLVWVLALPFCRPVSGALARTKVVLSDGAGRLFNSRLAPIASKRNSILGTLCRTINIFYSLDTPLGGKKIIIARGANSFFPFAQIFRHNLSIAQNVNIASVASEMIGAHLAGWDEIVGIELSQEYCDIGQARLEYYSRLSRQDKLL